MHPENQDLRPPVDQEMCAEPRQQESCGLLRPCELARKPEQPDAHRRRRPRLRACRYLLDAPALLWKRDPPPLPFCASPAEPKFADKCPSSPNLRKEKCSKQTVVLSLSGKEGLCQVGEEIPCNMELPCNMAIVLYEHASTVACGLCSSSDVFKAA